MTKSGMNIGDTFTDDGRRYEVIGFTEGGHYISKYVGSEVSVTEPEAVAESEPINKVDAPAVKSTTKPTSKARRGRK